MIAGIDLSNNNPVADFAAIRAAGYEFCIHKASEGVGFKDRYLESRWREMKAANVARGCYHFARPSQTSARAEADYFLGIVTPLLEPGDSVWLDMEDERLPVGANASPWSLEWLGRVQQALGFAPGLYTYPAYVTERRLTDPALARYPLWWASYSQPMRPTPTPWASTAVWQYTSDGTVPGTTGRIDLNWYLGDSVAGFLALGKPGAGGDAADLAFDAYARAHPEIGPMKRPGTGKLLRGWAGDKVGFFADGTTVAYTYATGTLTDITSRVTDDFRTYAKRDGSLVLYGEDT